MTQLLPHHIEKRLTQRAKQAICALFAIGDASPLDLLYALARERGSLAKSVLDGHGVRPEKIIVTGHTKTSAVRLKDTHQLSDLKRILERSAQKASEQNQPYIGTEHILYALVLPLFDYYKGKVRDLPYKNMTIQQALSKGKTMQIKKHLDILFSQNVSFPSMQNLITDKSYLPRFELAKTRQSQAREKHSHLSALDLFCENLSERAESGKLDPVIGRDKEMESIFRTLSRRSKNNPLLVGEPGVGKTAIVQGLAQRINNGEAPQALLFKKILTLDINSLVAGTFFRGDFEIRMREIISESSKQDVILFIDEIHNIIGAGSAMGSLDAANILKPALANGNVRCIGATTYDEYKKYIEKDRALERRFQPIFIREESEEQAIQTLKNLRKLYEKHHDVHITEDAVDAAVRLAARYIPDRFLPDKALDILDEASSKLRNDLSVIENTKKLKEFERQRKLLATQKESAIAHESYQNAIVFKYKEAALEEELKTFKRRFFLSQAKPTLTREHIEQVVEEISEIPVTKISEGPKFFIKLQTELNQRIIGQSQAVDAVIGVLKRKSAGISRDHRPLGSFLFLGPSGVGKTALAKYLSEQTARKLIQLHMAEYAEPHTISRLIGSPPGYVGYDEGGDLTENIRRNPYALVLFDEIEKAHPQVHNILLSILEEGTLEDATGRKVTFHHALIILTSNAYDGDDLAEGSLGFTKTSQVLHRKGKYLDGMREALRPEIINRMDRTIVFNKLGKKEISAITKLFLTELQDRLPKVTLHIKKEVVAHLARHAHRNGQGARFVRATIERFLEMPLAEYLIRKPYAKNAQIALLNGKVVVT